jgi:membrane fusion protein (multidrug efflux system)
MSPQPKPERPRERDAANDVPSPPGDTPPHGDSHDGLFDPTPHVPKSRTVTLVMILATLGVVALFLVGYIPKIRRDRALASTATATSEEAQPVVTAVAQRAPATSDVTLPGTIQPLQETLVYARVSGYLARWKVDIGDAVTEGQLLAEIDTPEIDQELLQARGAAEQARALVGQASTKLELAKTVLVRAQGLQANGLVGQAEIDTDTANVHAEEANVAAAKANVDAASANVARLLETKNFGKVVAPFAGTITQRTTEVGALVNASTSALFKLSATKVVRIFVNVPQLYAPNVHAGTEIALTVRELVGRTFVGTVARTAKALDPTAHTLLTEIHVDNADGALLAGTFAQVKLATSRATSPLVIPATAVVAGPEGTRVAVVKDGVVHWQAIVIEDDLGDRVCIASGLDEGAMVVLSPGDKLVDGAKITVASQGANGGAK